MFHTRFYIAALSVIVVITPAWVPVRAQSPSTSSLAKVEESLKARFGFTDAQARAAVLKQQAIFESFGRNATAIREKYGSNPTTAQRRKVEAEIDSLASQSAKRMRAVLMSVATKEQRPRIIAWFKAEQLKGAKNR